MKTHLDNLLKHVPNLATQQILDLGSGRGSFLLECARRKLKAIGLEYNLDYIEITERLAREQNLTVKVTQGVAEKMPFLAESFDFVNIAEVIEHVNSPEQLLQELWRVLKPGGKAYLSVPNRWGLRDQHFHLYFINWVPRSWADWLISFLGKDKGYSNEAGRQRLSEMHYYTWLNICRLVENSGFKYKDLRQSKVKNIPLLFIFYPILRLFFFDSFHLLLQK